MVFQISKEKDVIDRRLAILEAELEFVVKTEIGKTFKQTIEEILMQLSWY